MADTYTGIGRPRDGQEPHQSTDESDSDSSDGIGSSHSFDIGLDAAGFSRTRQTKARLHRLTALEHVFLTLRYPTAGPPSYETVRRHYRDIAVIHRHLAISTRRYLQSRGGAVGEFRAERESLAVCAERLAALHERHVFCIGRRDVENILAKHQLGGGGGGSAAEWERVLRDIEQANVKSLRRKLFGCLFLLPILLLGERIGLAKWKYNTVIFSAVVLLLAGLARPVRNAVETIRRGGRVSRYEVELETIFNRLLGHR